MIGYEQLRTVFLDRDGVINSKAPEGEFVWKWEQFDVLDGVDAAIRKLNERGMQVFVVTNQRGVALGLYTEDEIVALHARFSAWLAARGASIGGFYYCPHDRGVCRCRKPDTGMMERALAEHGGDPGSSVMIGDSAVDIEAGRRMGMRTILITGRAGDEATAAQADAVCGSLAEAVELLSSEA